MLAPGTECRHIGERVVQYCRWQFSKQGKAERIADRTGIQATLLRYIGPDLPGPVTLQVVPRKGEDQPVIYNFPGGLANGTVVSSLAENGFTIDATARGETGLGSKMTIFINGVPEVHHTSCSTPYIAGQPAPLDNPKGQPSLNWFVVSFTQKD